MRPPLRRALSGIVVWGLSPLAGILLLAGWAGAHTWYPAHLRRVTGRQGVPHVSCLHCHRQVAEPPVRAATAAAGYLSPEGLAVAPDGATLYVAAADADRLLEVDLERAAVVRSASIPGRPHGVALSADGTLIAVSRRDADEVVILDAATLRVRARVATGRDPLGVALSGDGRRVFVADGEDDDVLVGSVGSSGPAVRLVAGNEPYGVALSADGSLLAVASRQARPGPPRDVPAAEVTFIDAKAGRVLERRDLVSAHLSEAVALSSDASFALVPMIRVRNLLPLTQVARGAVMNSAIAFIETHPGGRTVQLPLAEVNAFYADPSGVAITPDDRIAFVAHGGARSVTALDVEALRRFVQREDQATLRATADDLGASSRYVLARIRTRDNPRALAMSRDGAHLYVAERLADSIAIIDTRRLQVTGRIDLGGPLHLTAERRGERIFHDASVAFQGQFSCRSCHPDGHTDGLTWDFEIDGIGRNLVETRSLRGIRDTAPFKWNGKNPDLATQCGPRFARVLTRSEPFTPAQLDDLVAYIRSIPRPPKRSGPDLAAARGRGRAIFSRTRTNDGETIPLAGRCSTCHRPPLFTDRLMADVGTGGRFDTPHLFDVRSTAPYLHDGRALTLEGIWTVHNPHDTHGVTSDLTKPQLNDLVIYLRSL